MARLVHLDCGLIESPAGPACCHCVAAVEGGRAALVDCGIGLLDCADPEGRLGRELIDVVGFRCDADRTALRRLERLGVRAGGVEDVVLTHADPDHTGGLADFPGARVHVSAEELGAGRAGGARYVGAHFAHGPRWVEHASAGAEWFGLAARRLTVLGDVEVWLVELFGHTAGHCGVAVRDGDGWLLHAGDAYYLRAELDEPGHPVGELSRSRAWDDGARLASLERLRGLRAGLGGKLRMTGYHDVEEFGVFSAGSG